MAPGAGIWLRTPMSTAEIASLDEILEAISDRCEAGRRSREFWVTESRRLGGHYEGEGRPFFLLMGKPDFLDIDPEEIEAKLGFLPGAELAISAHLNAPSDHRILGHLCIHLAELFGGLVNFGGPLPDIASEVAEGEFYGLWYTAVSGNPVENHLCDPAFLRGWMRHSAFHMLS